MGDWEVARCVREPMATSARDALSTRRARCRRPHGTICPRPGSTTPARAGDGTAGDNRQLRRSVVVRLHWTFVVGWLLSSVNLIYSSSPHAWETPGLSLPTRAATFPLHRTRCNGGEPRGGRFSARAPLQFPGAGRARHIRVPDQVL
jgi:hypothetical protein